MGVRSEYVKTFQFVERVPRWRAHFYDADGTLVFDMNQSEALPPLRAWTVCELPQADMLRLVGGVEIDEHG